ncbi:hypothetical protein QJQ45_011720 [Haematococcus lacustris]|nr:hypothetical protein QJQ45_011720 [Haematococcus lacustris]
MKGKKRKGADGPKQPNPKQPKPKRKDKPDDLGWVGPVSPLELCRWQHRGRLPAQGKEYPALGFKKLRERAPKAQAQQPVAQ